MNPMVVPALWAQETLVTEIPWLRWGVWLLAGFFGVFPGIVAYMVWAERKVAARFQDRIGPNRVGPLGLLQPIADALKLITKENIVPAAADAWVHLLAPILLVISAMLVLAVIPFGVDLAPVNLPSGLLYLLAVSSLSSLGIFLAGWSSRNKYALLGGMRAVAQLISYEIPQVLAIVPVVLWTGSLSLVEVVKFQQREGWFLVSPPGLLAFVILTIASIAETNRAPFDLPEAESEIIAGFHTEYSGMRFGLFFLAEYMSVFAVSCLGTVLFLGGGSLVPLLASGFPSDLLGPTTASWLLVNAIAVPVFAAKVFGYIFLIFWIRATLPRMRVDRLMNFAWKVLIPLGIVNILAAAIWYEVVIRPGPMTFVSFFWGWAWSLLLLLPSIAIILWLNRGPKVAPRVTPAPRRRPGRVVVSR